ncbi:antibiotic biosynthesis monooxygenase family protein [Streptosporangium sp. KLBMP 9127]|nr:antibiotic biosynthesis monooxygenase [Streptosporangium sp. KLBMP 9127]
MTARVRVLVYATEPGDGEPGAVTRAYHRISGDLAGTRGLLGNELLRSVHDPSGFVVMSEWESLPAFRAWEEGAGHRQATAPLRPYQDHTREQPFAVYAVEAAYPAQEGPP